MDKEIKKMRTPLHYENRIAILTAKGAEKNRNLIAKAKRNLKKTLKA